MAHRGDRANRTASVFFLAALVSVAMPSAAVIAGPTWDGLRTEIFGQRPILHGDGVVELAAPMRPDDQSAVPISVSARFSDGRTIRSVSIIVDENPSPLAAVFTVGGQRTQIRFGANFRLNSATDLRAVVEASDGQLYMAERHVRFAGGQAACSAPPQGDPDEILASMGEMRLVSPTPQAALTPIEARARLEISHPNHTGMVLDQISLLYIPLRMISQVEAKQGEDLVFSMAGSISLSQNPAIDFDYRVNGSARLNVSVSDTDGAIWTASLPIGQGS